MTAPRTTVPAVKPRYDNVAIALHWLLALLLIGAFAVGSYMSDLPFSIQRIKLVNWHKWAGMTILALTLLRLLWRLGHTPPPDAPAPRWQQQAARWTHRAIYLLCLVVPVVGWAYSSAVGVPIVWFGVLPLPDLLAKDKALADLIKPWHAALAYALAALVLVHVAAALKHHFVDGDGLLARMRPGRR
jgi:cytochrome b561